MVIKKGEIKFEDDKFSDRLDVLKEVMNIKSNIRNEITSDFVLSKLSEKDKEGIIEMTGDAYFAKKVVEMYARKGYKYVYDPKKKVQVKVCLDSDEIAFIKARAQMLFDAYMNKIIMTAILNRNVSRNALIRILAGKDEDEKESESMIIEGEENKGVLKKAKKVLKNEEAENNK